MVSHNGPIGSVVLKHDKTSKSRNPPRGVRTAITRGHALVGKPFSHCPLPSLAARLFPTSDLTSTSKAVDFWSSSLSTSGSHFLGSHPTSDDRLPTRRRRKQRQRGPRILAFLSQLNTLFLYLLDLSHLFPSARGILLPVATFLSATVIQSWTTSPDASTGARFTSRTWGLVHYNDSSSTLFALATELPALYHPAIPYTPPNFAWLLCCRELC